MFDIIKDIQNLSFWKNLALLLIILNSVLLWIIKLLLDKAINFNDALKLLDEIKEKVIAQESFIRADKRDFYNFKNFMIELIEEAKKRSMLDE